MVSRKIPPTLTVQTTLHKKTPVQYFLDNLGSTLNRPKPYTMLSERVQTTLHMEKSCSMLS